MAIRTASLEYLGIVAARLRKDAVSSHLGQETIDDIVSKVNEEDKEMEEETPKKTRGRKTPEEVMIVKFYYYWLCKVLPILDKLRPHYI